MKIDVFTHIVPQKYLDALMKKKTPTTSIIMAGTKAVPTLTDIELRMRIMDQFDELVQILTLAGGQAGKGGTLQEEVELSRIANDEMAELLVKHPDRFVGAVAAVPLSDVEAAIKETERAVTELKFRGIQIFTDFAGEPIDLPKFRPLYEKMVDYNLPIWIHPSTRVDEPDYVGGKTSDYSAFMMFSWPYETTVAMNRLVHSGIMEDYPTLKFITHHGGGMVPYFADRITGIYDYNQVVLKGVGFKRPLKKRPIEYFRKFYGDTVHWGSTPTLMCMYDFYGADHILFATDMPYDNQFGLRLCRETIKSIERMDISSQEKEKIFEGNARELLRLPV
jgi:predicted TIM-barrel fold metal-dependent hydrolase